MTDFEHNFWPAPDESDLYWEGAGFGLILGVVAGAIGGLMVAVILMGSWYAGECAGLIQGWLAV